MPRTGKRGKYKLRPLSPKQITMFKYLIDYIDSREYPPSIREIGDHAGIPSTSVVNYNLNKLEEHKLIFREKEVSRAIRINWPRAVELGFAPQHEDKHRLFQIPLLGNIVASNPVNVGEVSTWSQASERVGVSSELVSDPRNVFALRVQGDSMVGSNILDNDIVLMEVASEARNGDMVSAWLIDDDEMTLKRYYREGDNVRLQPSSPDPQYQPIVKPVDQVAIQGKVLAVVRIMH